MSEPIYIVLFEAHPSIVKRARAAVGSEHLYGMAKRGGAPQTTLERLGPRGRRERAAELQARARERKLYGKDTGGMPSDILKQRIDRNLARQQQWAARGFKRQLGPVTQAARKAEQDKVIGQKFIRLILLKAQAQEKRDAAQHQKRQADQRYKDDLEAWRQAGSAGPMPTLDAGKQLSLDNTVQVRAYTKTVDGKEVSVRAYTRTIDRKGIEEILNNGKMANYKRMANRTEIYQADITLDEKVVHVVWKPSTGEGHDVRPNISAGTGYLRELAGYKVGELMGLGKYLPVVAVREGKSKDNDGGVIGAALEYVDTGLKNAAESSGMQKGLEKLGSDRAKIGAFDYLIGNEDRHDNNWKVSDDGSRIKLLDHGLTFPSDNTQGIRSKAFFAYVYKTRNNTVRSAIGDSWDNKWSEIYNTLTTIGIDSKSIEATRERYEDLIRVKNSNGLFTELKGGLWG